MNNSMQMDLDGLKALKVELLARLTTAAPADRPGIQAEITSVNATIKAHNIANAARLKAKSDERRMRGRAEDEGNLARAIKANVPPGQRPRHLGEEVIIYARRLAKVMNEIPLGVAQPFTLAFVAQLKEFIDKQREHLTAYNAKLAASATPSERFDWERAWVDSEESKP